MDEYINKHEAWQAIEHEAQTHELPASKEAYERAAMIISLMKPCKVSEVRKVEDYSEQFDKLRKNRVEVSFFKYGPARENFGAGRVDAIGSLELCLEKFKKTHNTEYLLDVANYAMFRYMYPLPGEFFRATDSSESAGTVGTPINLEEGG